MTTFTPLLTRLAARYRLADGLWRFTRTAWLAPLAAVALLAAARSWPIADDRLWALGLTVALLLLLALLAWRRPMGLFEAARRTDRALGLKDRLATAWVLQEVADRGAGITAGSGDALLVTFAPHHDLVARQRMDALAAARDVDPRRVVPLRASRRPLVALALLSAGAVALALLPNPQHAELARRAAVRVAARQLAEEVRRREEAVAGAKTLSAEVREQAGGALRELRAALDGSRGRADADLAALAEAETALRSGLDRETLRRAAGARSLAERLEALSREARRPSSETAAATPSAKDGGAGEALSRLAAAAADADQASRDSLARALRDEAQAVGRDQPEAATQLAALADALSHGDQTAAGRAAQALGDSLDRTQAAAAGARTVEDALGALQAGRTALAQANASGQLAASPAAADGGTVADAGGAQGQSGQGQEAGTPGAAGGGQQAGAGAGSDSQAGTANGSAEGAGQGEGVGAGQPGEAGSDAAGQGTAAEQGTGADAGQGPGQEGQGTGEGQAAGEATTPADGASADAGGGDNGGSSASGFGRSGQAGAADASTIGGAAGDQSRPGGAPSTTAPGAAGLVYAPPRRLGPLGERSFVPGSIADDQDTGIPSERPARQPGLTSASRVPYREVFPAYREAAGRALQRETIPLARRDYVRAYFAQLGE